MVKKIILTTMALSTMIFAEKISDKDIKSHYYTSYELEGQERYKEAINSLMPIVKEYPNGYLVNFRMGWLAYKGGHFADAEKYYKKALTQYPYSLDILKNSIVISVAKLDWAKVEEKARQMITIDYYNIDANYWLAYALRESKKEDKAIKVLERALAIYPTNISLLTELGKTLFITGKISRSMEIFNTIIILDPYNVVAQYYLTPKKK